MNKSHLPKITIIGGEGSYDYKVLLNGLDISGFVNRVEFVLDANEITVPEVKLTIVGIPEIPEELHAIIKASQEGLINE